MLVTTACIANPFPNAPPFTHNFRHNLLSIRRQSSNLPIRVHSSDSIGHQIIAASSRLSAPKWHCICMRHHFRPLTLLASAHPKQQRTSCGRGSQCASRRGC